MKRYLNGSRVALGALVGLIFVSALAFFSQGSRLNKSYDFPRITYHPREASRAASTLQP